MNDRVFFDSNILVYSYSSTEPQKQTIARKLITDSSSFISTQVLQELTNIVVKKFNFTYQNATDPVEECCKNSSLTVNSKDTILLAHQIANRYNFSFYDSLIVSAALECDCSILYSEDMHSNQVIDKKLRIVNPFKI
jgi:predicted nucleic acid-binding protein